MTRTPPLPRRSFFASRVSSGQMRGQLRGQMRGQMRCLLGVACLVGVGLCGGCCGFVQMPGASYRGALATPDTDVRASLERDIGLLAGDIGPRHDPGARAGLDRAADYVRSRFVESGVVVVDRPFVVDVDGAPHTFVNLEADIAGTTHKDEVIVIGAHYDSAPGTPGANDNASGVAVLLHIAAALKDAHPERTLRLVAFANEEPPYFDTPDMGSLRYAKELAERARGREKIVAMISLETLGCYKDDDGSQHYPPGIDLLYPSTGNFVGFVSDLSSVFLTRTLVESFRRHAQFPSEGAALPGALPGVYWSDHASFWSIGVPAVMVTDTAPFRSDLYHTYGDVPETVNTARLALVASGLVSVVDDLSRGPSF